MTNYYWTSWYSGFGWILWLGMIFLIFSNAGNWNYTYRAHRRFLDSESNPDAFDILAERYAKGEILREEYLRMHREIVDLGGGRSQGRALKFKKTVLA